MGLINCVFVCVSVFFFVSVCICVDLLCVFVCWLLCIDILDDTVCVFACICSF